jgi:hypothetical protein
MYIDHNIGMTEFSEKFLTEFSEKFLTEFSEKFLTKIPCTLLFSEKNSSSERRRLLVAAPPVFGHRTWPWTWQHGLCQGGARARGRRHKGASAMTRPAELEREDGSPEGTRARGRKELEREAGGASSREGDCRRPGRPAGGQLAPMRAGGRR